MLPIKDQGGHIVKLLKQSPLPADRVAACRDGELFARAQDRAPYVSLMAAPTAL